MEYVLSTIPLKCLETSYIASRGTSSNGEIQEDGKGYNPPPGVGRGMRKEK